MVRTKEREITNREKAVISLSEMCMGERERHSHVV